MTPPLDARRAVPSGPHVSGCAPTYTEACAILRGLLAHARQTAPNAVFQVSIAWDDQWRDYRVLVRDDEGRLY